MKSTITEALAEIKLIEKKLETKKAFVRGNLIRPKHVPGGVTKEAVGSEVQAIGDLQKRLVSIRAAIAKANLENHITINSKMDSITGWLTWKREVADKELNLYKDVYLILKKETDDAIKNPRVWKDEKGEAHLVEWDTNLDYQEYVKKAESTQDTLDKLDGQLSLKNATTVIEVN